MARIRSFGPGNSDLNGITSYAKLNFRGNGSGCFVSGDPTGIISHGGFNDITIRAVGEYEAVFNLPNCVEMTWDKCTIEALGRYTGGIRAGQSGANPAWINKILGCSWRLNDAGDSWVADLTWSDSEVIASHFTGGLGSIDRGYGVVYIGNQFERLRYRALRVSKELEAKQGSVLGNRFDANSDVGLEVFVNDDASNQYNIALSIAHNQFRT